MGRADASEALQLERAALISQLARATGLGRRPRRLGDETESARKTVGARIRDTLRRIDDVHPALGAHLRDTVTIGTVCRYTPTSARTSGATRTATPDPGPTVPTSTPPPPSPPGETPQASSQGLDS